LFTKKVKVTHKKAKRTTKQERLTLVVQKMILLGESPVWENNLRIKI